MAQSNGYIHGSDLLMGIYEGNEFKPFGHSSSCEIENTAETKSRATKETTNTGRWEDKSVSNFSVSVNVSGFRFYGDEGLNYPELLKIWEAGDPVTVRYAHRGEEKTCYREGKFIITSLKESAPADDDATYDLSMENSGKVETVEAV